MEFVLDLNSKRAQRARYKKALTEKWVTPALVVTIALSLLCGGYLLLTDSSVGWLVLFPATVCLIIFLWSGGDLQNDRIGKFKLSNQVLLHEGLELSMLGRLQKSQDLSAYDLWKCLENSAEHYFLQNRYLIGSIFFEEMISKQPGSAAAVWQKASSLQEKHQSEGFTNMLVLIAIVMSVKDVDQLLNRLKLSVADIEASIPWMADRLHKQRLASKKQTFGGIGRDWAFGYTPILGSLGRNISAGIENHGFFQDTSMHEPIVNQMLQIIGGRGTVTLVGDAGVGKTTAVYAFAERLLVDKSLPSQLRFSQVIEMDASSLIANAKNPGQLEDLMIKVLNEAHQAKNIILFFDEAQVFFGEGTGSVDLSHVLMPALESSSVRLVFAMSPGNWQKLASAGIAAKLQPVNVPAADEDNTLAILRDQIAFLEHRHRVVYTYQALREAYVLGGRYVNTQSMPGAALDVLEQAATTSQQELVTREGIQQAVEQAYGVKLQTAQESDDSSKLLQLEDKLRQRVISQERAISVISNALRRSRSGVGNLNRPIGTFLFLGPTGVGKTELSKALAATYFGDEKSIIRVDMNQYVEADGVKRLITPMSGTELGFLGEIRKKPFSVVLLDEIEKAHSTVKNALLQMLDEGVMRDKDNKAVSFKDAIIIATSNAGADEIRRLIDEGQDLAKLESTFVDTLISRGDFAPEFVNRFDEVVLFKPLSQDDLIKVIDLIIAGVNTTLDAQKVRVELSDPAKRWLVEKGYDSKLGARPMRRMTQRYVENIVAKRLLDHSAQPGSTISLDAADFEKA